jgi:hypothetical protein
LKVIFLIYNNAEILPYDIPSSYQYKIYRKDRKELIDKNDGGVLIMVRADIKSDECILAFLYLLSLLIFESDFSNSCIAFSSESGGL